MRDDELAARFACYRSFTVGYYIFMNKFSSMLPPTVEANFLCKRRPYVFMLQCVSLFSPKNLVRFATLSQTENRKIKKIN